MQRDRRSQREDGPWFTTATTPAPSSRVTVVVAKRAAQPLSALDLAFRATDFRSRFDDLVRQGLVIAFAVVMK